MGRGRRAQAIEAARSRREERRRRASEERLRIAQELHDVLAHNISLINVQAGVALHLIDDDPDQARSSLAAIKSASGDALSELRSVLDILRQDEPDAPRSPTPSLADLERLIDKTRAAGLDVSYETTGERVDLPSSVERAAYRVVQEALTNVVRHASGASASVIVAFENESLVVEVTDDGRGVAVSSPGGGNGIPGMRARVEAVGGTFAAGLLEDGGFRVRASFPLSSRPREEVR
jgi:signal transduction histidine kinase